VDTNNSDFSKKLSLIQDALNTAIQNLPLAHKPEYLYSPIRYVLSGYGKRLRPILVCLVGEAFGAEEEDSIKAAVAMELLHNFTLVHDDIMDADDVRHGQPSVHAKWDESTAILSGDGMFAFSQLLLTEIEVNTVDVIREFNNAALLVCEGQAYDKEFEHDASVGLEQYFTMIEKKTGYLIAASAKIGGIIGDQDKEILDRLESYGLHIGRAFQIQDDILEIYASSELMGKSLGSDIVEGKQTVLTILAREKDPEKWTSFWNSILKLDLPELIEKLRQYLDENGILNEAQILVESHIIQANEDLKIIPEPYRQNLLYFSDIVLKRKK